MKALYRTILLAGALLALFSCNDKPEPDPVEPAKEEVKPETRTLNFVLPDGAKQRWVAGDEIVVHGEYSKNQVVVTLTAGDISSDGKTATKTVEGLYPYKREDCSSDLYASYPAAVSDNLAHCFFYSKFSTTNEQIMAACNSGDTFRFENICGILTFSVQGDYDGYLISSPRKEALGYEFLQVKLTDTEKNYLQYKGEPVLALEGSMSGPDVMVYIPESSLSDGISVKLKTAGAFTNILRYTEPLDVERGAVLDLGDLTDLVQEYDDPFSSDIKDLDTEGNANCYIVTEAGSYKFKAVVGNKASQYVEEPSEAVVLWETLNDESEVAEGTVLESASYAEDYIIIHTPETLTPGNAVVAVMNADGEILWSWHIWIPADKISTASYGGLMGADAMDRNLGALVAAKAVETEVDPLSYGLVYQWGRKDPFTAAGSFNGSNPATCSGLQDEVAPGQITIAQSVANPKLLGHVDNGDWTSETNNELWSNTDKTIYDPCPPGYRVPAMNTSATFFNSPSSQAGWAVNSTYGWITLGDPVAVFPVAGYRDDYDVGGMAKVGVRTLYWCANGVDSKGSGDDLRIDKGTYSFGSAPKARLGSVRCVLEQ